MSKITPGKRHNQEVVGLEEQVFNLSQGPVDRNVQIDNLKQNTADLVEQISLQASENPGFVSCFFSRVFRRINFFIKKIFMCSNQEITEKLSLLPEGFDSDMYVKLNPDLVESVINPAMHYLNHGRKEGRSFLLPAMDICCNHDFKVEYETILFVGHEASRTGAPTLTLNIVQALVKKYNVVLLLLGDGPLFESFVLAGAMVINAFSLKGNPLITSYYISNLCKKFHFKFAIVNSIESRVVLPVLGGCFVPTISLMHEFASMYACPQEILSEACFWSSEIVFSANLTLENAITEYPSLGERSVHILPQGRCLLPLEGLSNDELQAERARIVNIIRPKDNAKISTVVIGAGSVQLRKGIDLFIECANRVIKSPQGESCRFVWIGKGYDPDNDDKYSVYLEDQIRRAGLKDHIFIIGETVAIETAYEVADIFLLSSRLDPLPNVAIDAMAYRLPVICFDKTTGIADFLIESGLSEHCVAEYIDTADMAQKILALANSKVLREQVASRCYEASRAFFNMQHYVFELEVLAKSACAISMQEQEDVNLILDSGLFRQDFFQPTSSLLNAEETLIRAYVRGWASGISRRKPFPGFHPGIYKEQHGITVDGSDPFADFLKAGQPSGPWNCYVITSGTTAKKNLPDNLKIALHLHVYYLELLPEITERLKSNHICPDLFISIASEIDRHSVISHLKGYQGRIVDIQLVPNRGRDIGPFLTIFGQRILENYDFVGHVHTKKSADVKDASKGKSWYKFMLENLLGGESGAMADHILTTLNNDASIGMVFPDDPNLIGWDKNREYAEMLAEKINLKNLPNNFLFPIGTMFWARTSILAPLINLKLEWDDYPQEPLPYDGSSLHAIERLFGLIVSLGKLRIVTTNVNGLTR